LGSDELKKGEIMRFVKFSVFCFLFLILFTVATADSEAFQMQEGERLAFSASYLHIIPVGDAAMDVKSDYYGGQNVYMVTCEAKTAKWISLLFKAQAMLRSYMGKRDLLPLSFEQVLQIAGKPDDIRRATYDRANNMMEAKGKGTKRVPPDVRDPISAVYFLRTRDLQQDMEIDQTVNNNQSTYIFKSKVIGKKQVGKFDCWVLSAKIRRENKTLYHSMDALFYISDDERHLPVKVSLNTNVGAITLRLKE
jgi:hypothetical protein